MEYQKNDYQLTNKNPFTTCHITKSNNQICKTSHRLTIDYQSVWFGLIRSRRIIREIQTMVQGNVSFNIYLTIPVKQLIK